MLVINSWFIGFSNSLSGDIYCPVGYLFCFQSFNGITYPAIDSCSKNAGKIVSEQRRGRVRAELQLFLPSCFLTALLGSPLILLIFQPQIDSIVPEYSLGFGESLVFIFASCLIRFPWRRSQEMALVHNFSRIQQSAPSYFTRCYNIGWAPLVWNVMAVYHGVSGIS